MLPGNLNVSRTFVRARAASSDGDEEGDLRAALQQSRRRGRRAGAPPAAYMGRTGAPRAILSVPTPASSASNAVAPNRGSSPACN